MATLHLIGGSSCMVGGRAEAPLGAMRACAAMVGGDAGDGSDHRVVLVGDRVARGEASAVGMRVDRAICPPLGRRWMAWPAIRRERGVSRVVVWSPGLDGAARLLGAPVEVTPWARVGNAPPLNVANATQETGDDSPTGPARAEVRAWLGASEGDRVVMLLADSPGEGDARRFAFLIGLLEVGIGPVFGVMSSGSSQLARGRRFHRLTARRSSLVVVEGGVLPWVVAGDAVIVEGAGGVASGSAVRAALRAGVRVVGPAWARAAAPAGLGERVLVTDGRSRSLLPAMLLALGVSPAVADGPGRIGSGGDDAAGATIEA